MPEIIKHMPVPVQGAEIFGIPATSLTAGGVWLGIITGLLGLITLFVKQRPGMRKLTIESEAGMRAELNDQLKRRDEDHAHEKMELSRRLETMDGKIEAMRAAYEAKLEAERATHERELRNMRHRMNNLDQCLYMVLVLIEANADNPDKVREAAKKVRELRAEQERTEKTEVAVSSGVRIAVAQGVVDALVPAPAAQDGEEATPATAPVPAPAPKRRRRKAAP